MVFPGHGTITALTGNVTGAMTLEAIGSLLIAFVASYFLYRFGKFIFGAMDRAEQYGEQSYRNRAYIKLMVTGLQAGMLKQVAVDEKIALDEEIKLIPTDSNNKVAEEIKTKLMKDIKTFE